MDTMMKKNSFPEIMTLVGYMTALLFLAFGLYILRSHRMDNVPKEFRTIFGVVVISYGFFRAVIIYQRSKQRRESEDEPEF
jgi:uncharacterized membrane protein